MGLGKLAEGAGSAIIGSALGMALGKYNDQRQYQMQEKLQGLQIKGQKELASNAHELQLDSWNKTNYGAQVEHLKKAGLNPALLYGMGGTGGATMGGVAGGAVSGGAAPTGGGEMGMGMQMALMNAQKENIEADTANKKAGVEVAGSERDLKNAQTLTEGEKFTKTAAESQEANRGLEDRLTRIKAESIGAEIENDAKKVGIEVDKERIKQMAAQVAQGWKGLDQNEQKLRIEKFRAEMDKAYPNLMNVAGRTIDDAIEAIFQINKSDRNKQLKRVGEQ